MGSSESKGELRFLPSMPEQEPLHQGSHLDNVNEVRRAGLIIIYMVSLAARSPVKPTAVEQVCSEAKELV